MKIEIWSDIMCPFCYIGKRNLEAALSELAFKNDIEIEWKSFLLNPELATDPELSTIEYLAAVKNMSVAQAREMTNQVAATAAKAGLTFNFDNTVVANTRNAHRLIQMAKEHGLGDKAEETLFEAYFMHGKNMDDSAILVNLGQNIGLEKTAVEKMLNSDQFDDKVRQEVFEAQQLGITGVPFFAVNNKYGISGAQPKEVFVEALTKAYKESIIDSTTNS